MTHFIVPYNLTMISVTKYTLVDSTFYNGRKRLLQDLNYIYFIFLKKLIFFWKIKHFQSINFHKIIF